MPGAFFFDLPGRPVAGFEPAGPRGARGDGRGLGVVGGEVVGPVRPTDRATGAVKARRPKPALVDRPRRTPRPSARRHRPATNSLSGYDVRAVVSPASASPRSRVAEYDRLAPSGFASATAFGFVEERTSDTHRVAGPGGGHHRTITARRSAGRRWRDVEAAAAAIERPVRCQPCSNNTVAGTAMAAHFALTWLSGTVSPRRHMRTGRTGLGLDGARRRRPR